MEVIPFKQEHLKKIIVQQNQVEQMHLLTEDVCKMLELGSAYTAMDGEEVLACAGVIEITKGRAAAWSYLSQNIGSRLIYVTRAVKRFLHAAQFRRIEMDVDCDFKQAHRWANMLGFELECERRRSFTPDGRDCALYAIVR